MPLTPEQIAKIRKKEAETPDALKRNPLNDYTEGWFHVTLNTRGEAPVLGYLVGDPNAEDGSENAPRCVLTDLGKKVEEIDIKRQYIRNNPRKRLITRSKPDRFRVMRNQHSKNWTLYRALAAVAADPWIGRNQEKCRLLQANVSKRCVL